ncbi:MAG: hypothetical protein CMC83_06660, partial [Flavobacteriaceae bacterium]|nr:hypothetical protein [Flavobacteriaceae bacterium]
MLKLKLKHILSTLIILLVHSFSLSQNAIVSGIILNELNEPIENVSIQTFTNGTISNQNGFYKLIVASNT